MSILETNRYIRQTCLAEVGENGQKVIANAHILVVGAGGLGCAVLPYLVTGGVGNISIVDGDRVSLSNLHRQVLYREADVNQPKVLCAANHLHALNKDCNITHHFMSLTPSNVAKLCDGVDIVLDCADNFAVSYMLSDYCHEASIKLVSASALGFTGYVGGFCGKAPSLRAVFPELPQRAQNCSSAGVMGPVVGAVGCIQAQYALNILLDISPSPLGQLLSIDLQNLRQSAFRFDDAPEPPAAQQLRFIDAANINPQDWVVDLRGPKAQSDRSTQITEVLHHTIEDFQSEGPKPGPQQRAVMVCRTGLTAWRAARLLQDYWQGDICLIAMHENPL